MDIVLPQQTERPQNRDARVFAAFEAVDKAVVYLQATEDDDDAVEDIETVADVAEETVSLDRKDTGSFFFQHSNKLKYTLIRHFKLIRIHRGTGNGNTMSLPGA